ncbi:MAG: tail fiber domain-containing protein [Bacteriovoracaceae bacterium]
MVRDDGFVGIGTTTPTSKLSITGDGTGIEPSLTAGAAANFNIARGVAATTDLVFNLSGTSPYTASLQHRHSVSDGVSYPIALNPLGGNVGIGTTSPSYKLDVTGTVHATGAATFDSGISTTTVTYTSDRRLKTNIESLPQSLEKILNLKGVMFDWKNQTIDSEKQIGFIAQDVQKQFPELVRQREDGFLGINYAALVSPIVEAIKEFHLKFMNITKQQNREVAALKEENKNLRNQMSLLNSRLDKLEKDMHKVKDLK